MAPLQTELLAAAGMAALSILFHLAGLNTLTALTRFQIQRLRSPWLALDRVTVPLVLAFGLFTMHAMEVGAFAVLFHAVHATRNWEESIYFSASAYSTADVTSLDLNRDWRVTGSLESLNGVLLIGWSTAFLFMSLGEFFTPRRLTPCRRGP